MYAPINGTTIFFDIDGLQYVPDGPTMRERPVCFVLHGGPGNEHSHFLPETYCLADTMQAIYIDDRNTGRSGRGDLSLSTMKQNVDDLEALRKYLGLGKIFVLGHSYGGMKALTYMLNYPDSLQGVILADTAPRSGWNANVGKAVLERGTEKQKWIFETDALKNGTISLDEYLAEMSSLYYWKWNESAQVEIANKSAREMMNGEMSRYQLLSELSDFNLLPALSALEDPVPTLILCGVYDHITPPYYSAEMYHAIKHSELHVMDECAHDLFFDRPDLVFPYINNFVAKHFVPGIC